MITVRSTKPVKGMKEDGVEGQSNLEKDALPTI